ncbi:MAG: response regulator transcription factor [Armatimonadota bacterium]
MPSQKGAGVEASESRPYRVLIVEDDTVLLETLHYNLQREGFEVQTASDAETALRLFHQNPPDAILLDVMLPARSGFELCRLIRQHSQVPILFLTARTAEEDRVRGLEMGGDDYIVKPFGMRELIARIRAILRRAVPEPPSKRLRFGELEIDLEARRVLRNGVEVSLSPREFDLLALLATHPGKVFSRDELLNRVWGLDIFVSPRTVDVHIRWLRTKIEPDPEHPRYLHTVRGIGYRFDG